MLWVCGSSTMGCKDVSKLVAAVLFLWHPSPHTRFQLLALSTTAANGNCLSGDPCKGCALWQAVRTFAYVRIFEAGVSQPLCPIESCPVSLLFGHGQAMNGTNVTAPPTLDPSRNLLWMGTANGTVFAFNTRALERVLCMHTRVYSCVCASVLVFVLELVGCKVCHPVVFPLAFAEHAVTGAQAVAMDTPDNVDVVSSITVLPVGVRPLALSLVPSFFTREPHGMLLRCVHRVAHPCAPRLASIMCRRPQVYIYCCSQSIMSTVVCGRCGQDGPPPATWSLIVFGAIDGSLYCYNVSSGAGSTAPASLLWRTVVSQGYSVASAITDGVTLLQGAVRSMSSVVAACFCHRSVLPDSPL